MYFTGIQQKFVKVGDLNLSYGERGQHRDGQPSLFFIHGFSADKNMYFPLIMVSIFEDTNLHYDKSYTDENQHLNVMRTSLV